MICRLFLAASLAASLAVAAASAYAQAEPVTTPAIPPHKCVKPEYPGKLASNQRFTAFNKDYTAYGACIRKYVDETKLVLDAAAAAVNGAVDEFNKFAADIKAQDEATKN
jgi:predicted transcriptional regulator